MKKQFINLVVCVLTVTATAGTNGIWKIKAPDAVQMAFKSKYPDATVEKWKKRGDTYIAHSKKEDTEFRAYFNAAGKWLKTATFVNWSAIPQEVQTAFEQSEYGEWTRLSFTRLETADEGTVYIVEAENDNLYTSLDEDEFEEIIRIYISSDGKIIKKSYAA